MRSKKSKKGIEPTAQQKRYLSAVVNQGCIVCYLYKGVITPAECHHPYGAKTKEGHDNILGLCVLHHRQGDCCHEWISYHPWKARFTKAYGTQEELLKKTKDLVGTVEDYA